MPISLVTGGAGFIGSHLARELIARGHQVVVLDDLSGGFIDNLPQAAVLVTASVTDRDAVARVFATYAFDYVFHLAAYAAEGLSHFIRAFNYTSNVVGSAQIINECVKKEVRCLVFTSSIAVYGAAPLPMREDTTPRPQDPYGIAKYAVELDLAAARDSFGLNYVIFRPHNVYGEHQNIGDPYRNVIGIFMNRLMRGEVMTVFGDGTQTRAFSYIGDIVPTIARAVEIPGIGGEVFNIGADREYTVNELARAVAVAMDAPYRVVHAEARREVLHAYGDHAKLRGVFGATPQTPLELGLKRMAEWAKCVGARESRTRGDIEVSRGLPATWHTTG